jgi:hypothetical protein
MLEDERQPSIAKGNVAQGLQTCVLSEHQPAVRGSRVGRAQCESGSELLKHVALTRSEPQGDSAKNDLVVSLLRLTNGHKQEKKRYGCE